MNLFIWNEIDHVSNNYHNHGGLVVVAKDLDQAIEAIKQSPEIPDNCGALTTAPIAMFALESTWDITSVYVFPNAGCC